MQLNELSGVIEDVYYDLNFIIMLESHLTYLRSSETLRSVEITSFQGYKWEGDLYGLLDVIGIQKKYHYITMRVNGYDSSSDFKGDVEYLLVPDFNTINTLKNIFLTKSN